MGTLFRRVTPDEAPEFTEVSLHGRQDFSAAPAAVAPTRKTGG